MEEIADRHFEAPTEFEKFAEARRLSANGLLWQVPGLSLTSQAFLIGAAIDDKADDTIRTAVAALAIVIALATMQLLQRHRYREQVFSHALDVSRRHRGRPVFDSPDLFETMAWSRIEDGRPALQDWREKPLLRMGLWPAWKTWTLIFLCFVLLDAVVMADALELI